MIIGRTSEVKYLNTYYDREGSQIIVIYGQKGIGKTAVINQFIQDKPHYYYRARSCSEREQLYQWGKELRKQGVKTQKYPAFTDILDAVTEAGRTKKVIVIDDFHYIVKNSQSFMKELVAFAHDQWNSGQLMVILCSSSIGWVENIMVGKIGEAAFELSGFLKIKELSFQEMFDYFTGFRIEECVEAYAILGGIPGIWQYFDDKISIKENICRNILSPRSFLHKYGERMVAEDLRETGVYNTILAAIAEGSRKLNDLYLHTEFSRAKISVYIKNLMELELVEKVFSYDAEGKENVQKGVYRISNHFVNFYFTYFYPNISALNSLSSTEFYTRYIAPTFKSYVADYFRMVCTQKLDQWNKRNRLPFLYEQSGEWVGKTGNIDIVAQDDNANTLIGLCNWEKPMMTYEDYEWLLFSTGKAKLKPNHIYLFSVGRFDEKLSLEAKVKANIKLIGVDEF